MDAEQIKALAFEESSARVCQLRLAALYREGLDTSGFRAPKMSGEAFLGAASHYPVVMSAADTTVAAPIIFEESGAGAWDPQIVRCLDEEVRDP